MTDTPKQPRRKYNTLGQRREDGAEFARTSSDRKHRDGIILLRRCTTSVRSPSSPNTSTSRPISSVRMRSARGSYSCSATCTLWRASVPWMRFFTRVRSLTRKMRSRSSSR